MLTDLSGRPLPPSDIARRLERIDNTLGMVYVQMGANGTGTWAITKTWTPTDPRRAHIQAGSVKPDEDWDVIAYLPPDCPVEQAYGYFVSRMKTSTREDVRHMLNRVHLWNETQRDANWQPVMDEAMSQVEGMAHGLVRAGSTQKRRKRGE